MTLSAKVALAVCGVYALLFTGLCSGTMLSFVLGIGLLSASYLVLYVGAPLSLLSWVLLMVWRILVRREGLRAAWTGVKFAVIIFGLMGMTLWFVGMVPPTAKTFTLGYWFHVKAWADVDEIRAWAAEHKPAEDEFGRMPEEQWPSSLRRMPFSRGTLLYRAEDHTVTFSEGGGFGHWGVTVGPKGTPIPDGWYVIKLEDGAWVWHERQ